MSRCIVKYMNPEKSKQPTFLNGGSNMLAIHSGDISSANQSLHANYQNFNLGIQYVAIHSTIGTDHLSAIAQY